MKVSPIWATGLICLVVGGGIGSLITTFFAPSRPPKSAGSAAELGPMPTVSMGAPSGSPGGKKGEGSEKGGFRGPSAKNQLAFLVTKLDLLTGNPLTVSLGDDQKKAVEEQVRGLEALNELSEEDAQKRLDALLGILANHKDTLVAVGYWWPGEGGFRPPSDTPNPFTQESNAKALKAVQERLAAEPGK